MVDAPDITLDEMIDEVEREIVLRKHVYPRWIAAGQISQEKASRQLDRMRAAASFLRAIRAEEMAALRMIRANEAAIAELRDHGDA